MPELPHLEPLPGLPLLAPLGNLCLTGVTSTPAGAARLAPSDIMSTPFGMAIGQSARAGMAGVAEYTRVAGVAEYIGMAGATGYVDVAGNAVPIRMVRVTRYADLEGQTDAKRQHMSDERNEHSFHGKVNARFDTAGITDGACSVARQTGPAFGHDGSAWVDVGSVGLYPTAGSKQDSGISEVMHSTHPGQCQLS